MLFDGRTFAASIRDADAKIAAEVSRIGRRYQCLLNR